MEIVTILRIPFTKDIDDSTKIYIKKIIDNLDMKNKILYKLGFNVSYVFDKQEKGITTVINKKTMTVELPAYIDTIIESESLADTVRRIRHRICDL